MAAACDINDIMYLSERNGNGDSEMKRRCI